LTPTTTTVVQPKAELGCKRPCDVDPAQLRSPHPPPLQFGRVHPAARRRLGDCRTLTRRKRHAVFACERRRQVRAWHPVTRKAAAAAECGPHRRVGGGRVLARGASDVRSAAQHHRCSLEPRACSPPAASNIRRAWGSGGVNGEGGAHVALAAILHLRQVVFNHGHRVLDSARDSTQTISCKCCARLALDHCVPSSCVPIYPSHTTPTTPWSSPRAKHMSCNPHPSTRFPTHTPPPA
jgi:hypothetical protein